MDPQSLARWLEAFTASIKEHKDLLTELDSAIGDADHGVNLERGMNSVLRSLDTSSSGALLKQTGMTLVRTIGGSSGPLYGTLFLRMSAAIDRSTFAAALRAGLDGVVARGHAEVGDKTMVDALAPAVEALESALGAGKSLRSGLKAASRAAAAGRDATKPMVARKGRASYLGERSIGHVDPGATSTALLIAAAAETLE